MGKRKSAPKRRMKIQEKLAKVFDCPCCNNRQCVGVSIQKKLGTGTAYCRACNGKYDVKAVTPYTAEIDIFTEWCDQLNGDDNEPFDPVDLVGPAALGYGAGDGAGGFDDHGIDDEDEDDVGDENLGDDFLSGK